MSNAWKSFEDFLNIGWGKRATRYLKEGAAFKVLVDKEPFSLSMLEGKMKMSPEDPEQHDVLIEISSSAIEFLSSAKTEDEAQERLGELIYHPTSKKYARMKIEAKPTKEGSIDFYWMGYYFWARRMRFAS